MSDQSSKDGVPSGTGRHSFVQLETHPLQWIVSVMTTQEMSHLPANQAMVLLDIYRGDVTYSRHPGNSSSDIRELLRKNYIFRSPPGYATTDLGNERVKIMLI